MTAPHPLLAESNRHIHALQTALDSATKERDSARVTIAELAGSVYMHPPGNQAFPNGWTWEQQSNNDLAGRVEAERKCKELEADRNAHAQSIELLAIYCKAQQDYIVALAIGIANNSLETRRPVEELEAVNEATAAAYGNELARAALTRNVPCRPPAASASNAASP